jgi:hypothetical protein
MALARCATCGVVDQQKGHRRHHEADRDQGKEAAAT